MKKIGYLLLFTLLVVVACSSKTIPPLAGGYESEWVDGYLVSIGIQPEEKKFVEYIDNREVDRGSYEKKSDQLYLFKSDKQEFEITLSPADSFTIVIPKLNEGDEIELKNRTKTPSFYKTEFDDLEEYEKLLEKK